MLASGDASIVWNEVGAVILRTERSKTPPDEIAAIGSFIILGLLPICAYSVGMIATGDIGGPLNCVLIPCSNVTVAAIMALVILLPSSRLRNTILTEPEQHVGERKNRALWYSGVLFALVLVVVAGSFGLIYAVVVRNSLALQAIGIRDAATITQWLMVVLLFGGVPLVLSVPTYWFLLELSRKLLWNKRQEEEKKEQEAREA